jgi:hypothetical protein
MRGLFKFVRGLLVLALFVAPPLLVVLALERYPLVGERDTSVFGDVKAAKAVLARFDPRDMDPGSVTEVSISEAEINSAIGTALIVTPWLKARADISGFSLEFLATAAPRIPKNPIGQYVNIRASIPSSTSGFKVKRLSIGRVSIPAFLVRPVAVFAMDQMLGAGNGEVLYSSIKFVSVSGDHFTVGIRPPAGLVRDIKDATRRAIQIADAETVRAYYQKVVDVAASSSGRKQSLAAFVGQTFALAKVRSSTRDPVTENRAAILALALYFGDTRFERLMGEVKTGALSGTRADLNNVKLEGRTDWVQHFIISAGLMVAGGATVADVIGQAKEVLDTDGPSGFSFTDLGADHTGIRFAQVATASQASARRAQNALAGNPKERDFFPHVSDLPEGLSEEVFKRRYGDVNSPAYTALVEEIDRRIAAIPLYR